MRSFQFLLTLLLLYFNLTEIAYGVDQVIKAPSGDLILDASGEIKASKAINASGLATFNNGISFGDNTLLAYKVSTFTPTLTGSTGGSLNGNGHYVRIGNIVFCQMDWTNATAGSGFSGNVRIGSLPYAAANLNGNNASYGSYWSNINTAWTGHGTIAIGDNNNYAQFGSYSPSTTPISWDAATPDGNYLRVTLTYLTTAAP